MRISCGPGEGVGRVLRVKGVPGEVRMDAWWVEAIFE